MPASRGGSTNSPFRPVPTTHQAYLTLPGIEFANISLFLISYYRPPPLFSFGALNPQKAKLRERESPKLTPLLAYPQLPYTHCRIYSHCICDWYQGHTGRPNQKHQPYVFSGSTSLGLQMAGAIGCKAIPLFQPLQCLQPTEIPALYFRRICRVDVFGDWSCWDFWCGPCMRSSVSRVLH